MEKVRKKDKRSERPVFMRTMLEKAMGMLKVEALDDEVVGMTERMVVLRIATKHINLRILKLEMKLKEISEPAGR